MLIRIIVALMLFSLSSSMYAQQADSAGQRPFRPGDQELFVMPTAYTMPAGSAYFEDYELFFLNFSAAITNRTHIGVFTLFPVTSGAMESITLGMKQNIYSSDEASVALFGSFTPKAPLGTAGGVISIGPQKTNIHFGYLYLIGEDHSVEGGSMVMVGISHRVSSFTSLIAEYENTFSGNSDFNGVLTLGFRLTGEKMAFDIAGIRPLVSQSGDMLFLPYVKAFIML